MAIAFLTLLAAVLGSFLVLMSLDVSGASTIAMVGFVVTIGVAFVLSMRRQHRSQDGGDRRAAEGPSVPVVDDEDERDAIPVMIDDGDRWASASHLDRWSDDGAPLGTAGAHR